MYQVVAAESGDPLMAAQCRMRGREIVSFVMSRLTPAQRTVGAEILALRFVERFAAAVADGEFAPLTRWVDGVCQRYVAVLPIAVLLPATAETAIATVVAVPGCRLSLDELARVRADVERLAARPRLIRQSAAHEAIDEIDVALDDLMSRLDQSDELTAEHSRAVSTWCARLAKRMALDKQTALDVARGGLIHDIGKISTPPAILNAPRGLTPVEYAVMQRHAADGAAIIAQIPLLAHLEPPVHAHHERFDGGGYPDRTRGEAIPASARIVCVADAFNAMIGRRPYRPPLAPGDALDRLVQGRGTHFDPFVVDAMIDVVTNRT
jgi:HD domain